MSDIRQGGAAEETEIGQIVGKLIDAFEQMDLPKNLDDMRIVVVAETEKEGVCAGSAGYGDDPKAVAADLMQHASVLLSTIGVTMEVMSTDELQAMVGAREATG